MGLDWDCVQSGWTMTISYQFNVHTATFLNFAKLLCRWRGSVYKFVVKEILVFASLYGFVSAIYRWGMDEAQRRWVSCLFLCVYFDIGDSLIWVFFRKFENVARHIGDNKNLIPLTFVLGFYVNFIVGRWWDHYVHNPWPDRWACLLWTVSNYTKAMVKRFRVKILFRTNLPNLWKFIFIATEAKSVQNYANCSIEKI